MFSCHNFKQAYMNCKYYLTILTWNGPDPDPETQADMLHHVFQMLDVEIK